MSEANYINALLYRKLEKGNQYNSLIPKYKGITRKFETSNEYSDTYDTLEFMAYWVEQYAYEFEKVAKVLMGKNVLETVRNNYAFLYKHFQYKIDENVQQIYAPSAAWEFRATGFDCKSFSVLASCLLSMQGIPHAFRKVKQPASNDWSHVYVVIPYQDSYLIIDATTPNNKEVNFIEKYDFNMKNLKHIGLARPYMNTPFLDLDGSSLACPGEVCNCGGGINSPYGNIPPYQVAALNGDTGETAPDFDYSTIINEGIKFVTSLFDGLDCIGGSAYDDKYLKNNIKLINAYFITYIEDINKAAVTDVATLGRAVANFKGFAKLLDASFRKSKDQGWNSCSTANFNATIKVTDFYKTVGIASLDAWLNKSFQRGIVNQNIVFKNYKSLTTGFEDGEGFWGTSAGGAETVVISEPDYSYKLIATTNIPAFELTSYALEAYKAKSFNASSYLDSLPSILNVFNTPFDELPDGNNNESSSQSSGASSSLDNSPSQAGGGVVMGLLALGVLYGGYKFANAKDTGVKTTATKKQKKQ